MDGTGTITMTMRDLDRLKVIQAVVDGNLKPGRAAERLGLTVRQVRRLVSRVRLEGVAGLVSRRYGRPSNNRTSVDFTKMALDVIRARYADFRPTLILQPHPPHF
ncbi:MAG: helix-turn-helix domain-containing protein [Noviherbaspirillum sp.]